MEKRIAMLLNGEIKNDYRVIKMINTLSYKYKIDLYYINGNLHEDQKIFERNVSLYSFKHHLTSKVKLFRHSLFCFEFNFLHDEVIKTKTQYDIIWANDLPTLYPAYKLSKKLKSKLIYDSHEIYNETINQFFPRNNSGIKKVVFSRLIAFMRKHGKKIEKKIFPSVNLLITVNESLLDYFSRNYVVKKGIVIMNVPDKSNTLPNQRIDFRSQFSWDNNSKIIIYQGHLNEGRGLRLLPQTLKLLPNEYKLIILGSGPLKKDLSDSVKKLSLEERIKFIDAVPLSELPKYTLGADAGVNLLESFNLSKQLASPNKLFEYIHSGIPVIASKTIENQKVLERFRIGVLSDNDPGQIAGSLIELFTKPHKDLSHQLSLAKDHYTWERQEELLYSALD